MVQLVVWTDARAGISFATGLSGAQLHMLATTNAAKEMEYDADIDNGSRSDRVVTSILAL
ncbi:MAG TPA: hypothetical protein VN253_03655 [Kofleriaceae bacterium]|nr:hypothetical protein [Kofleriaceae bacterium]